jgi:hypothetical protein
MPVLSLSLSSCLNYGFGPSVDVELVVWFVYFYDIVFDVDDGSDGEDRAAGPAVGLDPR